MLTKVKAVQRKSSGAKFAIVASEYNAEFVDSMLKAAKAELKHAGAKVEIVRVPGAYEIPVVVAKLAQTKTC
jgi:6,7-dimethyl-8-ribityllumazine synthase